MERERSLSGSSADSWSVVLEEEINNNNENEPIEAEAPEANKFPASGDDDGPIFEMDSLESVSSLSSLPPSIDLSSVALFSSCSPHSLLVITTPASSSIVTQSGAILSPEQSAALSSTTNTSDPNSPVLLSPPKSPPIESSFTFLKDPKLRISFSDSSESKEEEDVVEQHQDEEEERNNTLKDEGEELVPTLERFEEEEQQAEEVNVEVELVKEPEMDSEHGGEAIIMGGSEGAMEMMNVVEEEEKKGGGGEEEEEALSSKGDESSSSEVKGIVGPTRDDGTDMSSIFSFSSSSSRAEEYSTTNDDSTTIDSSMDLNAEEEGEEDGKNAMDAASEEDNAIALEDEQNGAEQNALNSAIADVGESAILAIDGDKNCSTDEGPTPSLPLSNSNHSDNSAEQSIGTAENESIGTGWTELTISIMSTSSSSCTAAAFLMGTNGEEEEDDGEEEEETPDEMDTATMVAKRLDQLCEEQADETLWQRILDETFCSLKNFERSDRIINILIIAMFMTSISSMTILHILENTWIGNNVSYFSSSQHHRGGGGGRGIMVPNKMPAQQQPAFIFAGQWREGDGQFRADSRQQDDEWNRELRQCKDELLEAKHAYDSKAKLLHYVRFKEMEQEALVNELRRELDQAKLALVEATTMAGRTNYGSPLISSDHLDEEKNDGRKSGEEEAASLRRAKKRQALGNAVEREQAQVENEDNEENEENGDGDDGMRPPQPSLLPMIWPGPIAPSGVLSTHLTPPPVKKIEKGVTKFVEEGTDLQEDFSLQYWPSHFAHYFEQRPSTSSEDERKIGKEDEEEDEDGGEQCSEEEKPKGGGHDDDEEEGDGNDGTFGQHFLSTWRNTYAEIVRNLSTNSGRTQMLDRVKNVVVARLNRTIEKTTTALAAATKLVAAENFGQNLFTSTVREVMARVENSATGLAAIVDCLNSGLKCIPTGPSDWEEEEEEGNEEEDEEEGDGKEKNGKEKVDKMVVAEEKGKAANPVPEEAEGGKRTGQWLLQRATARTALRRQNNNNIGSGHDRLLNRTEKGTLRFARWLFARAALRQKQRQQQNGTAESETRSSLLRDDWLYARQKIRAKLRQKEEEEEEEDWFDMRQKLRKKAREQAAAEAKAGEWFFARQKWRQKLREAEKEEEGEWWTTDDEEEDEGGMKGTKGRRRKWGRKKWGQKRKKNRGWKKWAAGLPDILTDYFNGDNHHHDHRHYSDDDD